jgi:hypothetical protein
LFCFFAEQIKINVKVQEERSLALISLDTFDLDAREYFLD